MKYIGGTIFGIKTNGVSFTIDELSLDMDQSIYDYVCNVNLAWSDNGNGTYSVKIIDKNYKSGFPIGEWTLKEGYISFDWGSSDIHFVLIDADGYETKPIFASSSRGSASYINTDSLIRSIFTKAVEIVSEYPSAKIYNAVYKMKDSTPSIREWESLMKKGDPDSLAKDFCVFIDKLYSYTQFYKDVKCLLENSGEEREKRLLIQAQSKFCEYIKTIGGLSH